MTQIYGDVGFNILWEIICWSSVTFVFGTAAKNRYIKKHYSSFFKPQLSNIFGVFCFVFSLHSFIEVNCINKAKERVVMPTHIQAEPS